MLYRKMTRTAAILTFFISLTGISYADSVPASQYQGKAYSAVKKSLLADGWKVLSDIKTSGSKVNDYPEISCGSGVHAVCSVGFSKGNDFMAFTVKKSAGDYVIDGQY